MTSFFGVFTVISAFEVTWFLSIQRALWNVKEKQSRKDDIVVFLLLTHTVFRKLKNLYGVSRARKSRVEETQNRVMVTPNEVHDLEQRQSETYSTDRSLDRRKQNRVVMSVL